MSTYIIHNGASLLIPDDWHAVSTFVFLVGFEIHIVQVFATKESVHGGGWILGVILWKLPSGPAIIVASADVSGGSRLGSASDAYFGYGFTTEMSIISVRPLMWRTRLARCANGQKRPSSAYLSGDGSNLWRGRPCQYLYTCGICLFPAESLLPPRFYHAMNRHGQSEHLCLP